MAKYSLIASHYELTTQEYSNEVVISIPNVDLSTIQAIDNFTARYNRFDILNLIKEITGEYNLNSVGVKCTTTCSYLPIIEVKSEFIPCTENIKKDKYWAFGRWIYINRINTDTELFQKEASKMREIIRTKDLEEIKKHYPYSGDKDNFYSLVNAYISADPNNEESYFENLILKEFSNYLTFRKWIVAKERKKRSTTTSFNPSRSMPPKQTNQTVISRTPNEYTNLAIAEYNKQNGPYSYQTMIAHNLNNLGRQEEFLTPEEWQQAMGLEEKSPLSKPKTKKKTPKQRRSSYEENDD